MRIPEPLFVFINFFVRLLLRSPLHALMSGNVLLISYTGRKSGNRYVTPVRYLDDAGTIRCFTEESTQWWRNVRSGPEVTLLVRGEEIGCTARVSTRDASRVQPLLAQFLAAYPQDAVYQDIRLNRDGSLNAEDLARAAEVAVMVEFDVTAVQAP